MKASKTTNEPPELKPRSDSLLDQAKSAIEAGEEEEGNQYYDSLEEEDAEGGLSPINLPQEDFTDDEDDDLAQEKIYNICSSGKKTQI